MKKWFNIFWIFSLILIIPVMCQALPNSTGIWYYDYDGDWYGDPNQSMIASSQPAGYVADNTDCNDSDWSIHPGATEIAGDGIDQDCDGEDDVLDAPSDAPFLTMTISGIDVSLSWTSVQIATGYTLFYAPYPDASYIGQIDMETETSFSLPLWGGAAFYVAVTAYNSLGSSEYSNIEYFALPFIWYSDNDGDGYGDPHSPYESTSQPSGYVADNTDCDDTNATIHPGATEIAGDGIDQDCSDLICGAYVAPGVWKEFDCYNLAAIGKTTNDDPFTPSWRLNGGYWQWGRKGPDSSQWYDTNTENFAHGPTGSDSEDANDGFISSWDQTYAPDDSWSDTSKTANDPCPTGYRVPTESQWEGVLNNTQSTVGTWDSDDTNYSSAHFFGNDLMLPAAGYLYSFSSLAVRGSYGFYWSSTQTTSDDAWSLRFYSGYAHTYNFDRRGGRSVRCVAE